jgi:SAM-dependent methyltransferase
VLLDEPDGMAALGGYFDLIVLSHVLEYVIDVHPTIASLLDMMAPEGRLYIEEPDPARYDAAYPLSISLIRNTSSTSRSCPAQSSVHCWLGGGEVRQKGHYPPEWFGVSAYTEPL